jgi:hypothetical protein
LTGDFDILGRGGRGNWLVPREGFRRVNRKHGSLNLGGRGLAVGREGREAWVGIMEGPVVNLARLGKAEFEESMNSLGKEGRGPALFNSDFNVCRDGQACMNVRSAPAEFDVGREGRDRRQFSKAPVIGFGRGCGQSGGGMLGTDARLQLNTAKVGQYKKRQVHVDAGNVLHATDHVIGSGNEWEHLDQVDPHMLATWAIIANQRNAQTIDVSSHRSANGGLSALIANIS